VRTVEKMLPLEMGDQSFCGLLVALRQRSEVIVSAGSKVDDRDTGENGPVEGQSKCLEKQKWPIRRMGQSPRADWPHGHAADRKRVQDDGWLTWQCGIDESVLLAIVRVEGAKEEKKWARDSNGLSAWFL